MMSEMVRRTRQRDYYDVRDGEENKTERAERARGKIRGKKGVCGVCGVGVVGLAPAQCLSDSQIPSSFSASCFLLLVPNPNPNRSCAPALDSIISTNAPFLSFLFSHQDKGA